MSKNSPKKGKKLADRYAKHLPGVLFRVGTELFAGVATGVFIGIFIDKYFDTSPIFIILFFFLGCAAGIMNVFRIINGVRDLF